MKRYAMQIDEHTVRVFISTNPPEGAVELKRRPEENEILKIMNGECVYIKRQGRPKKLSLEQRIEALENIGKELRSGK